jgi:hypothetical protein
MNPGIGAARADNRDGLLGNLGQRLLNRPLNGRGIACLSLKAKVARAIIGQRRSVTCQRQSSLRSTSSSSTISAASPLRGPSL